VVNVKMVSRAESRFIMTFKLRHKGTVAQLLDNY
jgi:hypothetical protein